jgi:hypothetical protein
MPAHASVANEQTVAASGAQQAKGEANTAAPMDVIGGR